MIELILGTYGVACWLVFTKFKLVPVNTYTVCTAVLGGITMLFGLLIILSICHPVSHDGRFYSAVTQVLPQVRGTVVEVPVIPNAPLKAGDVLFRIDPRPYQYEVDRFEAMLASMNSKAAQLDARLASARAATSAAQSKLLVSESEHDRQARIALESSKAQIEQTQSRLTLANLNLRRSQELKKSNSISQNELEVDISNVDALNAELVQAQSAERIATEKLQSGGDWLVAAREELKRSEAAEREAQIAIDAESDGLNPEVRQTMAELDRERWELEQTTVRAPSDGYATHVSMRPGQMVSPFSLSASMMFVPKERRMLVATFPQNAIASIEPGLEAELAFKAYPGRIFQAKVARVQAIIPEGQVTVSGTLQETTLAGANDTIPVVFEYGDDVEALNLPTGAQVSVAIYTHHFHALSLVRKIILRIKSWENYAFFLHGLDALH